MKIQRVSSTAALILLFESCVAPAPRAASPESGAGESVVALGSGSVLWLEGTSTVHDYESRTTEVVVTVLADSTSPSPADARAFEALLRSSGIRAVAVEVPVLSLHSQRGAKLDKNLRRALRADEYPTIRFQLSRYTLVPRSAEDDTTGIHADGSLEVAGTLRPIALDAIAWRTDEGVWLSGSESIRMKDYGVRPPKMMLGTLKVHDGITVHYRLLLVPRGEGNGSPSEQYQ